VSWNEAVYALVRRVPRGRVATYGQIAELLGRPRGGREVGWAMSACSDPRVPCHRIVDRNGRLAPRFAGVGPIAQRDALEREGIRFRSENVDLGRYGWSPRPRVR
jgi:methylated-DNA-protein-cysteine methyltransferase-like protein